jgi:2-keto-4-pentenoate hydratase/2-oxohepta-3-ene-1,7-dioic acid hydratase in catechol pathway
MISKFLIMAAIMFSTNAYAEEELTLSTKPEYSHRKGMRFGYNYANKAEESSKLQSPHMFALGFEAQQTMAGGDWLDLLFIQNITISGLEQSVVIPTGNALVGFEINKAFQIGVGANVSIYDPSGKDNYIHLVSAVGWTQPAGTFSVPVHFVLIPDVNNYWRCAATTGVNW